MTRASSDPAFLPYGRQDIAEEDYEAVRAALGSDFLTTGPRVEAFEAAFAAFTGAPHAVACSNGTAALHLAAIGLEIGPGDVCIVPTLTFVATANCVRYQGGDVLFADVDPLTGLMTAATLEEALRRVGPRRVKAILPVHLGGRAVDLDGINEIAGRIGAQVVEDACHALGTTLSGPGAMVGSGRDSLAACFSFHPVKTITTAEGGMVTTADGGLAARLRLCRSHGIERGPSFAQDDLAFEAGEANPWYYEQSALGFNYRLPDLLCALGISQLKRSPTFIARRRTLAALYNSLIAGLAPLVARPPAPTNCDPAPHLYVALIDFGPGRSRRQLMNRLRAKGIGTQVHYIPCHLQPYYRRLYGDISLPGAEAYYSRCLSLPLHPGMDEIDVRRVVAELEAALSPRP
jgi:UDP-4-amino-4,6-dideoxy-N-acetyl-beta-L-altrosamine transaminase